MKLKTTILSLSLILTLTTFAFGVPKTASIVKIGSDINIVRGARVTDVVAIGGSVTVAGIVDGDVVAVGGSIHLKPRSLVSGNAVAILGIVDKAPGAWIKGDIVEISSLIPITSTVSKVPIFSMWFWSFKLFVFIGILGLAILVVLIFPKQVGATSYAIEVNPLKAFLVGLLALILACPIAMLLLLSIIGIPLILLELVIYALAIILGYIGCAQFIGKKLFQAFKKPNQSIWLETLLGIVLLGLIELIPILGGLVKSLVIIFGLGGVFSSRFGTSWPFYLLK